MENNKRRMSQMLGEEIEREFMLEKLRKAAKNNRQALHLHQNRKKEYER